jgi:hypothetical protein
LLLHKFLEAFDVELEEAPEEATADDVPLSADLEPNSPANLLIIVAKGSSPNPLPPGDIHRVMSKNSKCSVACIEYKVSYHKEHHGISPSLVDRGANGGVAGNDVRITFKTNRTVDIKGIDNHCCTNIYIGTCRRCHSHKQRTGHWRYEPVCSLKQRFIYTLTLPI